MRIMPFGTRFALLLKRLLGNRHDCSLVPRDEIERWLLRQNAKTCVIGHFHKGAEINAGEKKAIVLPRTDENEKNADGECF